MSKKTFKKAIGSLYKDRKIEIKDDGIYLIPE
jgi:predicted RNA-binding protein (virulence factor B family)